MDLSSDRILNDDFKDRRGYSHLKEEAVDRTMWRNRFRGGFGPVVRQNTERMNELFFADRTVYEVVCKNIVEEGRPQETIWRMHIACCIPKATNTRIQTV